MKKPVNPKRNTLNEIPGLAGFSFSHLLKILEAAKVVDAPKPDQSKTAERSKRFQSMWSAQIVPKVQSFIEQNLQTDEPSKGKWEKYIDRFPEIELNLSKALLEFLLKKNAVLVTSSGLHFVTSSGLSTRSSVGLKAFNAEVQNIEKELDLNSTQSKLIDLLDKYISLAIEKKKDSFSQYELKHKNVLINIFLKNITQNYARYIIQVQKSSTSDSCQPGRFFPVGAREDDKDARTRGREARLSRLSSSCSPFESETIQAVKDLIKQIFSNLSNLQDKKRTDLEFVEKLFEYLHKKNQIFLVSSTLTRGRWEEYNKKQIEKITQESGINQTQSELETLFHVYAPALILNKKQSIDNQQQIDELFKLFMININENWLSYFEKSKEQRVRNLLKISQSIILNSLRKLQNRKESSEMVEPAVIQRQIPNGDVMGENRKFQYKKVLKELKELEDKENVYNNEEEDYEYDMARNQLKTAVRAAKRIYKHIKDGEGDMEAWVQSKITTAVDYLDTVADYLDSCCEDDEEEKVEENKNLDSLVGKIANRRDGATDKAIQTINAYKEALNAIGGRIQQSGQRNVFAKQYTDAVIATNKLNANSTFAQLNDVKKMLTALADRINF